MGKIEIKYKPWEKVKTISWMDVYINCVNVYNWYITYNIWDGTDKFLNVDEWQLLPLDNNYIWFTVS